MDSVKQELSESTAMHPPALDGVDGYTNATEDGSSTSSAFAPLVKFTNDHRYVLLRDDTALPSTKSYILYDIERATVKWPPEGDRPPERHPLPAGAPWPCVETLNERTPKNEWRTGPDGGSQGPWAMEHRILILESETMAPFLFVTQTTGGNTAVSELARQVQAMRKLCGKHVHPVISLATTMWSKRFNRLRPSFPIQRYVEIGGDPQLSGPTVKEVARPSIREEVNDEIKF